MSTSEVVVAVLLACAVAVGWLCCLGLLVMHNPYARLHYLGPAATLVPALVVAAVLVRHSSPQACIKVSMLFVVLLIVNPVLTHVTARATRVREFGHLDFQDGETGGKS